MDILKQLANPNLITAGTTPMTAFVPKQNILDSGAQYQQAPAQQNVVDPVQSNNVVTPGNGYSPHSDTQVKQAKDIAYNIISQGNTQQSNQTSSVQQAQQPSYANQMLDSTFKDWVVNKIGNKGMYDKQDFTQYDPNQVSSINNSADDYYANQVAKYRSDIETERADNESISSMTLNGQNYQLSKTQLKNLNTLNPQFEQLVKEPMGVVKASQSIAQLKKIAQADPAGQMALIFSFMKSLDPSSTVREGEYANAENTRGVPDTIRNWYNKIIDGTFLTPQQVDSFATVSAGQADAARQQIRATASDFDVKAGFNGLPAGLFAAQIANRIGDVNNNYAGTPNGQPADIVNLSSQNPVRDLTDYKNRIANIESGASADIYGNKPGSPNWNQYAVRSTYGTERTNPNGSKYVDYAYGKYQFMGDYIPEWSKAALGRSLTPEQLMQNPDAQEKIMDYLGMQGYNKSGNWNDAAAIHFSGRPLANNNSQDAGGTSVRKYVSGLYTGRNAGGVADSNIAYQQGSNYSGKLSSGMGYTVEN